MFRVFCLILPKLSTTASLSLSELSSAAHAKFYLDWRISYALLYLACFVCSVCDDDHVNYVVIVLRKNANIEG